MSSFDSVSPLKYLVDYDTYNEYDSTFADLPMEVSIL